MQGTPLFLLPALPYVQVLLKNQDNVQAMTKIEPLMHPAPTRPVKPRSAKEIADEMPAM